MAVKQPIDGTVAEMRVLKELTDQAVEKETWITPAFWTMAGVAVTNMITVAVLVGWIGAEQAETLMQSVTALIGAAQVIIVNTALVWKFIAGRNQIQIAKIQAQAHYAEVMMIEKMRAAQ